MTEADLTADLISARRWSDQDVAAARLPMVDVPFVTVGGGLGSFAMVDTLRVAGIPSSAIRVLSTIDRPDQTYEYLAEASQIPRHERIRSDSGSTIDNIWGFPSYALREGLAAKGLKAKLEPWLNVLLEPVFADYYTPRASQVFESIAREAARIDWHSLTVKGVVRMVRPRHGGGYFSVLTPPRGYKPPPGMPPSKRIVYRSSHVHLAVGYPGVKFLPDLQQYRQNHDDFSRVVNAYEPHEYVYEELLRRPSTVMVRGSGIVASRILVRLLQDREAKGAQTTVLHLFRTYIDGPQGDDPKFRRMGRNGFAYQGFNYPKSAWGGQYKERLEKLDGPGRAALIGQLGGTSTPFRKPWEALLGRGREGGYYQQWVGEVTSVKPGPDQTITTTIVDPQQRSIQLGANFIIDATGLESDISEHRLLADLLSHAGASRNAVGRLEVEPTFEVSGTRNDPGRLYASGSATLGGYYAGVDSFLGLQYAALRITDDLASIGFGQRIGVSRSIKEWWRWMRNAQIPG
jgi:pSer/pThr/pTyr-binding forkhead associated (FHA) protein